MISKKWTCMEILVKSNRENITYFRDIQKMSTYGNFSDDGRGKCFMISWHRNFIIFWHPKSECIWKCKCRHKENITHFCYIIFLLHCDIQKVSIHENVNDDGRRKNIGNLNFKKFPNNVFKFPLTLVTTIDLHIQISNNFGISAQTIGMNSINHPNYNKTWRTEKRYRQTDKRKMSLLPHWPSTQPDFLERRRDLQDFSEL